MIGQSLKSFDAARFLKGGGRYTDDHDHEGQVYCAFVRSNEAHAIVRGVDKSAAMATPGVLDVFTALDLAAEGVVAIPPGIGARAAEHPNRDGSLMVDLAIPILAGDRVRYVGEPVALVVGESVEAARDGADAVGVDYETLPAVTSCLDALQRSTPDLWPEVPGNLVFDYGSGDEGAVMAALGMARHVVSGTFVDNRVAVCFTEPRAALAKFDASCGTYQLVAGCQSVHGIARTIARTLGVDGRQVQVVSPDTGGGFGGRSVPYPEYVLVLWAARRTGRPVKWTARRQEEFVATTQGRDGVLTGTMGFDEAGRILALRVDAIAALGARHAGNGPFSTIRNLERMLSGVYDIPGIYLNQRGVFTNTVPISAYRGVGRVEANYLIERLMDKAARCLGHDRIELRAANVIAKAALPKRTAAGSLYDSGDYAGNMELLRRAGDWDGFAMRRSEAAARGKLRGIALCNYIEGAGGGAGEYGCIGIDAEGVVTIASGAVDQGQGQSTIFRQLVAHALGVEVTDILVTASDTDAIRDGVGTNASRSTVRAGKALSDAANCLIETGRQAAARLLQADARSLVFDRGSYRVPGAPQEISLQEVARAEGAGLFAEIRHYDETVTYPCGAHLCEMEVDPETGGVTIVRFIAVDDVGRAINPALVRGQSHGGIAQGAGQALMEAVRYDADSGQLLTGSFMDYAVPRAADLPTLETIENDCSSPFTPYGIKGAGEGGATGAPATIINAILDALQPLGVAHIDMPATSEAVWRAIRLATSSAGSSSASS